MEEWINTVLEYGKQYKGYIIAVLVLFIGIIGLLRFQPAESKNEETIDIYEALLEKELKIEEESIQEEVESALEELPVDIVVDVKGAVVVPGVYEMEPQNRIIDAINKAGGLTDTAQQNAVNLAQIVEDQMVIYVPEVGEEGFDIYTETTGSSVGNDKEEDSANVNINTADKNTLMTLNGIGNSKAENILSYREEHGPFKTIEEIKNVSGIGEATYNQLKDVITVAP